MSQEQVPGTVRPRGRTERVRQAVIAATKAEVLAGGYRELTIERVAASAGVAKSTVYRRWRDTGGLLVELLNDLSAEEIPLADTGSVDEDMRQLALLIVRVYTDLRMGDMVLALISEAVHSEQVAAALRDFWRLRNDQAATIVRRAVARGELPAQTDAIEVVRALAAPIYYRLLVSHEPIDDGVAIRAAVAALAAARAGALK